MRRERIASVVTALALVLSAVGGGLGPASVTQTASAEWSEDCTFSDSLIGAAYNTIVGADSGCYWYSGSQTDIENLTATDAYANSLSLKDSADSYTTTVGNFQENTRNIAYTKGKIAVVRALENGSGSATMANDANVSVRDYYARQQMDLINDWNAKAQQVLYLRNTSLNIRPYDGSAGEWGTSFVENESVTLANGTTTNVTVLVGTPSSNVAYLSPVPYSDHVSPFWTSGDHASSGSVYIAADDPNGTETTNVLDPSDYSTLWTEANTQSQQVTDNMWQYAQGVESQYQAGELNATTLFENDPSLLANEATTSFNSTGYYGYSAAQLASIGYSGDLNQSHVVQINGANYTGTLFYSGAGGTTFETGKTYDFANFSGSFYMAASDTPQNETGIIRLDDRGSSFEIIEATNTQTGESVNKTVTQKYVYESANATNLQQEIERLSELREFYEQQASGGGGGFDGEPSTYVAVGLALVLLGALVAGRS